jgi:hypothetical protein
MSQNKIFVGYDVEMLGNTSSILPFAAEHSHTHDPLDDTLEMLERFQSIINSS